MAAWSARKFIRVRASSHMSARNLNQIIWKWCGAYVIARLRAFSTAFEASAAGRRSGCFRSSALNSSAAFGRKGRGSPDSE